MSLLTNRHILTLALAHFATDTYASMLPILWPVFVVVFNLDYAQVGFATACYTASSSLSQPVFGYLGDRWGSRWLGALGVAWIAVCITATALAPGYSWLLGLCVLAGLGAAAYHPQGALNTTLISGRQAYLGMALFMLGGGFGYAVGPVVAAYAIGTPFGLPGLPFLAVPGLFVAWWLFRLLGAVDRERAHIMVRRVLPQGAVRRAPLRVIVLVIATIILRSWVEMGIITFLPLLYKTRGLDLALASQTLFVMLVVESLAGLVGGAASDRIDRRWVLAASYLVTGPALLAFLYVPALPPLAMIALAGLGIGSTVPTTTVMGQELMPRSLGVASGLVMGLSFVASGAGIFFTGIIADAFGLEACFVLLAGLAFAGAILSRALPARRGAGQAEPAPFAPVASSPEGSITK